MATFDSKESKDAFEQEDDTDVAVKNIETEKHLSAEEFSWEFGKDWQSRGQQLKDELQQEIAQFESDSKLLRAFGKTKISSKRQESNKNTQTAVNLNNSFGQATDNVLFSLIELATLLAPLNNNNNNNNKSTNDNNNNDNNGKNGSNTVELIETITKEMKSIKSMWHTLIEILKNEFKNSSPSAIKEEIKHSLNEKEKKIESIRNKLETHTKKQNDILSFLKKEKIEMNSKKNETNRINWGSVESSILKRNLHLINIARYEYFELTKSSNEGIDNDSNNNYSSDNQEWEGKQNVAQSIAKQMGKDVKLANLKSLCENLGICYVMNTSNNINKTGKKSQEIESNESKKMEEIDENEKANNDSIVRGSIGDIIEWYESSGKRWIQAKIVSKHNDGHGAVLQINGPNNKQFNQTVRLQLGGKKDEENDSASINDDHENDDSDGCINSIQRKICKSQGIQCEICFEERFDLSNIFIMSNCYHYYCLNCLNNLLKTKIETKNGLNAIECPAFKCENKFDFNDVKLILFKTNCKKLFEKYDQYLMDISFQSDKNCKPCPTPDCGYPLFNSQNGDAMMQCPKCKKRFCFNCETTEYHTPSQCRLYKEWKKHNHNDASFNKWACENNARPCPECGTKIQKDGGCNHMKCPTCKHEWHWKTNEKWQGYGYKYEESVWDKENGNENGGDVNNYGTLIQDLRNNRDGLWQRHFRDAFENDNFYNYGRLHGNRYNNIDNEHLARMDCQFGRLLMPNFGDNDNMNDIKTDNNNIINHNRHNRHNRHNQRNDHDNMNDDNNENDNNNVNKNKKNEKKKKKNSKEERDGKKWKERRCRRCSGRLPIADDGYQWSRWSGIYCELCGCVNSRDASDASEANDANDANDGNNDSSRKRRAKKKNRDRKSLHWSKDELECGGNENDNENEKKKSRKDRIDRNSKYEEKYDRNNNRNRDGNRRKHRRRYDSSDSSDSNVNGHDKESDHGKHRNDSNRRRHRRQSRHRSRDTHTRHQSRHRRANDRTEKEKEKEKEPNRVSKENAPTKDNDKKDNGNNDANDLR